MGYQDTRDGLKVVRDILADAASLRLLAINLAERLEDGPVPCVERELEYLRSHALDVSMARGLLLDLWGECRAQEVTK